MLNATECNRSCEDGGGPFNKNDPLRETTIQIEMYAGLVVIPIGFVLNLLCLMIFIKSGIVRTPTGIHLVFLTLADNLLLVSLFIANTQVWARLIKISNLQAITSFVCAGVHLTVNVGFLWTGLLLVSATFERFLSVTFPIKIQQWSLYSKTKILMVVYFTGSVSVCGYTVLCFEIKYGDYGENECVYTQTYNEMCYVGDIAVNTVLANVVCSFLILVFSLFTSMALYRYKRNRVLTAQISQNNNSNGKDRELKITAMLVTVATLFLILRLPEMILYQLMAYFAGHTTQSSLSQKVFSIYPLFVIPVSINHSVNLFIYMKFMQNFRTTFLRCIFCTKMQTIRQKRSSHDLPTISGQI